MHGRGAHGPKRGRRRTAARVLSDPDGALPADHRGWDVDLSEVARIWRGGCIIRARLLERIRQEYAAQQLPTLLAAPSVVTGPGQAEGRWRSVVVQAVSAGIPVPGFSAALAY